MQVFNSLKTLASEIFVARNPTYLVEKLSSRVSLNTQSPIRSSAYLLSVNSTLNPTPFSRTDFNHDRLNFLRTPHLSSSGIFALCSLGRRTFSSQPIHLYPQDTPPPSLQREPSVRFLPLTSPYEYVCLSRAAYFNSHEALSKSKDEVDQAAFKSLEELNWKLKRHIEKHDYHAAIWINDERKQVVIAHRGSQNTTSWITDLETVVNRKPGGFVQSAIDTLSDEIVLHYINKGYRLSTTGHSLGGFLAQLCVYWAKRPDFKFSRHKAFREISAVVFDSPGVIEFFKHIRSNIHGEQNKVKLPKLNVQNYCAMPTIVSTYASQTGTTWHVGTLKKIRFDFVNAHRLEHMFQAIAKPSPFRQMGDWPKADYRDYSEHFSTAIVDEVQQKAFQFLNDFYKKFVRRSDAPTWFEQVFIKQEGQVRVALKSLALRDPSFKLSDKDALHLALNAHFSPYDSEVSNHTLALYHLDNDVLSFFKGYETALELSLKDLGWDKTLQDKYGPELAKLMDETYIDRVARRIVIPEYFEGTVFDFQQQLLEAFRTRGFVSLPEFINEKVIKGIKDHEEELKQQREQSAKIMSDLEFLKQLIVSSSPNFEEKPTSRSSSSSILVSHASLATSMAFKPISFIPRASRAKLEIPQQKIKSKKLIFSRLNSIVSMLKPGGVLYTKEELPPV